MCKICISPIKRYRHFLIQIYQLSHRPNISVSVQLSITCIVRAYKFTYVLIIGKYNRHAVQFCERFLEFITDLEVGVAKLL